MLRRNEVLRCAAALSLLAALGMAAVTVEIRGRVTNEFTEEQYRAVTVSITDRLGTEIGRTQPDKRGQYQIKVSGPRYVIVKASLEGYRTLRYQLDIQEQKESTTDLEHNKVFGDLRIPIYYQNITFREAEGDSGTPAPLTLEELLAKEDPRAVRDYQQARRQKESGDLKKAVGSLERLIERHPGFYIGYIDLGMILAAQQENDRALEIFGQAQKLRPQHPWAYVGLGLALNNKDDYRNAAQHLEKAVGLDPNSVNAQFQLGQAAFKLGDHDRALKCFEEVIGLDPKFSPLVYKTMASIYVTRQDPRGAARALESYLVHFPGASDAEKVRQILARLRR